MPKEKGATVTMFGTGAPADLVIVLGEIAESHNTPNAILKHTKFDVLNTAIAHVIVPRMCK